MSQEYPGLPLEYWKTAIDPDMSKTKKTKFKQTYEVAVIGVVVVVFIAYYGWYILSRTVRIKSCEANVNISIQNCDVVKTKRHDVIVQQCDIKNISKYSITVAPWSGKLYQKYWVYDAEKKLKNSGDTIRDIPVTLAPGELARGSISYRPEIKSIIVCPLDPATLPKKKGLL